MTSFPTFLYCGVVVVMLFSIYDGRMLSK